MEKNKVNNILLRKNGSPITCLTAYSKSTAEIVDRFCDIILVGDSISMTLYGMKSTREINLNTMILHAKTVKKYAKKSLVVFDMPYKTYTNKKLAYKNAKEVIKKTGCDAIKLEGGTEVAKIVKYLTNKNISVMGHIGLLPQSSTKYKLKGRKTKEHKKILGDAIAISDSGVFSIVIECVVENLAKKITNTVKVPTIGIGASKYCDGQILVLDDIIGLTDFSPKFVKKYSNVRKYILNSVKNYCKDVKKRRFPSSKNVYK